MNYSEGSVWRKWDLHVHTPNSIKNSYIGTSIDEKWDFFIDELENLPEEFKVIGINDYIFIDGYQKILEYKKGGRLKKIDTFLPILEFRIKKFAGHTKFRRINFHIIFSNILSPDIIQAQFLNGLQGKYTLTPGLNKINWNGCITKESIEDLGREIKNSVPKVELKNFQSDIIEGFNNLNVDEEQMMSLLKDNTYLQDNYLLAIGKTEWESLSWNDQSIAEKKDIINKVDLVFISSKDVDSYINARETLKKQSVNDKLLDCSDAHYNMSSENKDRIGNCFTWIKSDTTFEGLRQAYYEFESRVFVGDFPPALQKVKKNSTKYIKSLYIRKCTDSLMPETWFDGVPEIYFSSGLTAIIGNKGNGKSAITDILGLIGNSINEPDFSFLNKKKFRKNKPYDRSKSFEASIEWFSGHNTDFKNLSDGIDETITEKVKYLPQSFLEKICSEEIETDKFEREIKNVIFSHMNEEDKVGKNSFDEYIDFRTSEINKIIKGYKDKLKNINNDYIKLELQKHPSYLRKLEDKKMIKEKELTAHNKNEPKEVKKPDADKEIKEKQEEITNKLENLKKEKKALDKRIKKITDEKKEFKVKITELEKLKQGLKGLENEFNDFKERFNDTINNYNIEIKNLITLDINYSNLDSLIQKAKSKIADLDTKLDLENPDSITFQKEKLIKNIKKANNELSRPLKLYQKYLENIEDWETRKKEIIGNKETEDTIEYYKEQMRFINEDLENELKKKEEIRNNILNSILKSKFEIIELYKEAYNPVMDLIKNNKDIMKEYNLEFDASLQLSSFIDNFFYYISQTNKGSFKGNQEGNTVLKNIIEQTEFDNFENVKKFIYNILNKLNYDCRVDKDDGERYIVDQLKKNINLDNFYNFIFGLDYLEPVYKLKLGGKILSELSPGERGALLLIFYLLIDKGDIPLIVDQPEENLDNQSVYNILVQFIKKAKEKRQVIIVTHNPNLAVVCDADLIIKVSIEKDNNNKFKFISGAIENEEINNEIIKILEGTKPAFKNRKLKYENINKDIN